MDTIQTIPDKKEAIFRTTLDLIAERGFHNAPMSLIAKESGVSTGIIYHYFENKDDLIEQLYWQVKSKLSAALVAGDPAHAPFPEHLKQIWLNAFWFYVNHPQETVFLEQYDNSPYHEVESWEDLAHDDNYKALLEIIQADVRAGHITEMPFWVLYELTLGVAVGMAKRYIAGSLHLDADELKRIAELVCRSLQP